MFFQPLLTLMWLSLWNIANCQVYNGAVRLLGGNSPHKGYVQVHYNEQWGYVCHDHWDLNAASVACRQLGYPGARDAPRRSFFGSESATSSLILLDDVVCSGDEFALISCNHSKWGYHDCNENDRAGVVCEAPENFTVRLIPSEDEYQGIVEVSLNGKWYKMSVESSWNIEKAGIICREMRYQGAESFSSVVWSEVPQNITEYDTSIVRMSCKGNERHISECTANVISYSQPFVVGTGDHNVLHVTCQSHIVKFPTSRNKLHRFTRVSVGNVSRLLPPTQQPAAGIACADWSNKDANVICRQAGFIGLDDRRNISLRGDLPTLPKLSKLNCHGNETGVEQCANPVLWNKTSCSDDSVLLVKCKPPTAVINSISITNATSVRIEWTLENPPAEYIVTKYVVIYSAPSVRPESLVYSSKVAPITVGGLEPYKNYSFAMRVETTFGVTRESPSQWILTPTALPDVAPVVQRLTSTSATEVFVIVDPSSLKLDINGPLLGIKVEYYRVAEPDSRVTKFFNVNTSLLVNGLQPFTMYSVRLAFVNINGTGPYSSPYSITTAQDVPSKVESLKAVPTGPTSLRVSWLSPLHANGIITKYTVHYRSLSRDPQLSGSRGVREVDSTTFEVVIDGLEEYVNYSVSVYGKTTAGVGETATADLRLYSAAPSSAPNNPTTSGINFTTVNISWNPPPFKDRNGPIANYSVLYGIVGSNDVSKASTPANWIVLHNLTVYAAYEYRVAAVGAYNGTGPYTAGFRDNLERSPGPVSSLMVTSMRATSCVLKWSSPLWKNGNISHYTISFTSTGNTPFVQHLFNVTAHSDPIVHVVPGLEEAVEYEICVSAANQHGLGSAQYLNRTTESAAPSSPPQSVDITKVGSRGVVVSWTPPAIVHQNGPITAYVLHYGEEGALVVNKLSVMVDSKESLDPAKMFTININTNSLSTNVKYIVQVAAKTEDGEGPFSSAKSFILEDDSAGSVVAGIFVVLVVVAIAVAAVVVTIYIYKRWKRVKAVFLPRVSSSSSRRQGHIYEEPKCNSSKTSSFENIYDICGTPGTSSHEVSYERADRKSTVTNSGEVNQPVCEANDGEGDNVSIVEETVEARRSQMLYLSNTPDFIDNPQYGSVSSSLPESNAMFAIDYSVPVPAKPQHPSVSSSPRRERTSTDQSRLSLSLYSVPKSFNESIVMSQLEQRVDSDIEEDATSEADMYVFVNSGGLAETPKPPISEENSKTSSTEDPYSHLWKVESATGHNETCTEAELHNPYCNFSENAYQNVSGVPRVKDESSESESSDSEESTKNTNVYDVPRKLLNYDLYSVPGSIYSIPRSTNPPVLSGEKLAEASLPAGLLVIEGSSQDESNC